MSAHSANFAQHGTAFRKAGISSPRTPMGETPSPALARRSRRHPLQTKSRPSDAVETRGTDRWGRNFRHHREETDGVDAEVARLGSGSQSPE